MASTAPAVGLVEVYDLDSGPGSSVFNISTRGDVQTGDDVMIGGFIVFGNGSQARARARASVRRSRAPACRSVDRPDSHAVRLRRGT